ncbi:MAG: cytosine deaminase, partial [Mesorhizobium sp.]
MDFDLIVRGGTLPDGRIADIGIAGETIAAIEPQLQGAARSEVDARGNLVSPPFVD